MPQTIVVLDFGSQYTQVIARRIREANVFSSVLPYNSKLSDIRKQNPAGIVLSGGPASVFAKDSPKPNPGIFKLGVPILGICYGLQLMGKMLGGEVKSSDRREYGRGTLSIERKGTLFSGLPTKLSVWNSHGDSLAKLPKGFRALAKTENSSYAAIEDSNRKFFGLQFHPEVEHSEKGNEVIKNFLTKVCGCKGDWDMGDFLNASIDQIREVVGKERVILGLSGGVDSSVAAALIHKAIGDQLTCIFVDNGLLRLNEREQVKTLFKNHIPGKLRVAKAGSLFLKKLKGEKDPEKKRKIIGKTFIEVFDQEVSKSGKIDFLAQGTLYPDVIESVPVGGNPAALIKSHHNVGGLPKRMKLKLLEPLRELFKDEVRNLGRELGLPESVLMRHPFPGPGLGVRVVGDLSQTKLKVLREADHIFIEELFKHKLYHKLWQAFCVFLPVRSVGVMGDERTYENVICLRAVTSSDAMTADWAQLPDKFLRKVSNRIINEVKGANRVVYDISSKPPSTIEWE
ncbi:MAG: glutamine-hydrolyzing GMP synthase [Verrucomicrobiota bacterium]|nr:glutamine-hydrolyzing GMP synthase [Verrucomicrobiota bacterium]